MKQLREALLGECSGRRVLLDLGEVDSGPSNALRPVQDRAHDVSNADAGP